MGSYSDSGVDREKRAEAKKAIGIFAKPKGMLKTPYNDLFPFNSKEFYVHTTDGVGTKVLLTQWSGDHAVAGWDAVAMVVNDAIRSGATPESITNAIDIADSSKHELPEILRGINAACVESGCFVAGGETADLKDVVKGVSKNPYHINASCFARVDKSKVIDGKGLKEGDVVIGLESNGLHSNGFSLVRKSLFHQFGGFYDALHDSEGQNWLKECVKPTRIYVKPFLALASKVKIKAAVNITGDAYLKFDKLQPFSKVGFQFDHFKPQEVFLEIQKRGVVSWSEMFKTFNMGWGFAVIVSKGDSQKALKLLASEKIGAAVIGKVVKGNSITVNFEGISYKIK